MYTLKLENIEQVRIINSVLGLKESDWEQMTTENLDKRSLENIFRKLDNSYSITSQTGEILRNYRLSQIKS